MHALRAFYCHEPITECAFCELSNVMNHKEIDDRKNGEPDGSPFFLCARQKGAQHSLLSPLDYTIVKTCGLSTVGKARSS